MIGIARARSAVAGLPRFARTVRWLTLRQILSRFWISSRLKLYARLPVSVAIGRPHPAHLARTAPILITGWLAQKLPDAPSDRLVRLAMDAARGRFTFLNQTLECPGGPMTWHPASMTRLWQYNLHYADYVAALALLARHTSEPAWTERAWALVDDWIASNPPGSRPGWEPYPLSLRLVNWAAAVGLLWPAAGDAGRRERVLSSIADQAGFLSRHLEHHLGGNHLVKNAKALIFSSVVVDGPVADRWRRRGWSLLLNELRHQVLQDGGHVERSPLYHAIVLEDTLDCLALASAIPGSNTALAEKMLELTDTALRMARWLGTMLHPDGRLPLFNDCVVSGDLEPQLLLAYARRLLPLEREDARETVELRASGYYVLQHGDGRMIIDCGEIGPDELPAHAHADTLSYELSWGQDRVVVDSGTAEYALDDLRRYVRSTRAHNTVAVNGADQSEVWASHRVGRRARPLGVRLWHVDDGVVFTGAHDGYVHLGVTHHRHVAAVMGVWIVVDELVGTGSHAIESFVHLHPAFAVEEAGGGWTLLSGARRLRLRVLGRARPSWEIGWYCPEWGSVLRNPVLRLSARESLPTTVGYVLSPEDCSAEVGVEMEATGIVLKGSIDGRCLDVRSERCTSSL